MAKKIKVIHVVDKFGVRGSSVHGVSRLFSWWFPRFDTQRCNVRLVGLRQADQAEEQLRRQGIEITSLGKGKMDFTTVSTLVRMIRDEQPDILHLHGYGAANFGRMAARLTGVKTIVHEHFVDPAMPRYQIPFDYFLAKYTDWGIAVSKSVKDFMVTQRYIPSDRVEVIFNGAPLEQFTPLSQAEVDAEKKRLGILPEERVIATIGRLDVQKGNRYLIDAAADVLRERQDVRFLLVGDGPLMNELQEQCRKLGIEERFIFTGYCEDIPRIQSIVDIQVFPSLWEGTPLTLFEAMSMGRAIVSTNVDGLGEVLVHEENALVVSPRQHVTLAKAIQALLADPQKAQRLAQRAREDSANYNIRRTVERMEQVYERMVAAV